MKAVFNGVTVAESDDTIVVEGNHYFPPDSVRWEHLCSSRARSVCPWKGVSGYYHVHAGDQDARSAAWTYRHPFPWIRKIRNHVAFWGAVEVLHDTCGSRRQEQAERARGARGCSALLGGWRAGR